jgi:uncharacterized protein (DUF983 family)
MPLETGSALTTLQAMRRGLCPVCRRGRVFSGRFRMHDRCPVCQVWFEREPGYFVGAMYISYALAVPLVGGLTALLWYGVFPRWSLHWVVLLAAALLLPLVPLLFRYSRLGWMYLDRRLDPDGKERQE